MAVLINTTVNGVVTQAMAASQPTQLVRLGELQSLLAGYMALGSGIQTSQVIGLAAYIDELVFELIQNTESISWSQDSGVPSLMADVNLAPNGALAVNGHGIYVLLGSGADEAAAGNHSHSGLPILPVTFENGATISFGQFDGRQIPSEFQGGTPLLQLSAEIIALNQGGILATGSGVAADFGPNEWQVARGGDVADLLETVAQLVADQPTVLSTASLVLTLQASPGFPSPVGSQFPVLYEVAGELPNGAWLGGRYEFDFSVQINGCSVTALAPQTATALELFVNGAGTGQQIVVPAGVANTEVTAYVKFDSGIVVNTGLDGLTPPIRWQCVSGAASIVNAVSQVDLNMWAQVISTNALLAGASFPLLFERAGELETGGYLGGQYAFPFPVQLERVSVTAMAPQVTPVTLELMVGGEPTGNQIQIPVGAPNTEVTVYGPLSALQVGLLSNGVTPEIRWQCISGPASIVNAASQVNLVVWAVVLSSDQVGGMQLSGSVSLEPGGGLQTTPSGVGAIWGAQTADYASPGTIAPGPHTHLQLHNPLTTEDTVSVDLIMDVADQVLQANVILDPDPATGFGFLAAGAIGLSVVLGTASDNAAAGDHTHNAVTDSGAGFMTPSMLAQLNAATGTTGQVAPYYRSAAISGGNHCGGGYRWPQAMEVIGVNVVALNAPAFNEALSLVIGGVQQPLTIIIPSGLPGTEVFNEVDGLTGIIIPMEPSGVWSLYARWVCSSGAGTLVQLASEITLSMNVQPVI